MTNNQKGAQRIYERNKKNKMESVSGTGSTLQVTKNFRNWLEKLIKEHDIKSILDVPCGDWNWMQHVDLSGIHYLGCDIVPDLIKDNEEKYFFEDSKRSIGFTQFDIINQDISELPLHNFDLIICRDFLFHLTLEQASKVLDNFKKSGSKYLISTTFDVDSNADFSKEEKETGWSWRPINLHQEPFNLGEEIDSILEPEMNNRKQKLWKIQ